MNLKNIVTGAFVGTIVMNILMPFIITKGATSREIMLLYLLPLVGALTSLVLEIEKREADNLKGKIIIGEKAANNEFKISALLGKGIKIRTYSGAFISGILKDIEDNLLVISSAKRLDTPESISSSILFIDKKDIREIELSNENTNISFK